MLRVLKIYHRRLVPAHNNEWNLSYMVLYLNAKRKTEWNGYYEMWKHISAHYMYTLSLYKSSLLNRIDDVDVLCVHHKVISFHFSIRRLSITLIDMTSAHGREQWQKLFEMKLLKIDFAFRMKHLNIRRQWEQVESFLDLTHAGQTQNLYPTNRLRID